MSIPESTSRGPSRSEGQTISPVRSDIMVIVLGSSGSGKSTFINCLSDEMVDPGYSTSACTTELSVYPATRLRHRLFATIYFVDTPSLEDTCASEARMLTALAPWLRHAQDTDIPVRIVYLHRTTDTRISGNRMRALSLCKDLCGEAGFTSVAIVITMWDRENEDVAVARESELKNHDKDWRTMLDHGAHVFTHYDGAQSAWDIVSSLMNNNQKAVLQIQTELSGGLALNETTAGKNIESAYKNLLDCLERDTEQAEMNNDSESLAKLTALRMEAEGRILRSIQDMRASRGPSILDVAFKTGNLDLIQRILDRDFETVATGSWAWLHELRDLSYDKRGIVQLLVDQRSEHPWIYFAPWASVNQLPTPGHHIEGCVHQGGRSLDDEAERLHHDLYKHHSSAEETMGQTGRDTYKTVVSLCGIAGIVPPIRLHSPVTGELEAWKGEISLGDASSASAIFRTPDTTFREHWDVHMHGALDRFCSAAALVQRNGQCCDSFTILRLPSSSGSPGDSMIELCRVDFSLANKLKADLEALSRFAYPKPGSSVIRKCAEDALNILESFSIDYTSAEMEADYYAASVEGTVQVCALAVQALCLGFVSYCGAHVGPPTFFFLERSLTDIRLLGAQTETFAGRFLRARLQKLTCLNDMLHDSVFVFETLPEEAGQELNLSALGLSQLKISELSSQSRMNLLATPQDVVETWGPGNFAVVPGRGKEPNILHIVIGGGCIYPEGEIYHWGPGFVPASSGKTTKPTDKIIIGATITENSNCCPIEGDCLRLCDGYRDPLGTFEPHWEMFEQQAGIQAGQYATFIFNFTWAKRTGFTLKERQMLEPLDQIVPFLESTWGLQVSFCSSLARRVKMRELMADILPAFVARKTPTPPSWNELCDLHDVLNVLRDGDLWSWFTDLGKNNPHCHALICALIRSITIMLHDTGIDPSGKNFVVAWVPAERTVPFQCIKIPTVSSNFWTKVLQDASDCATFAYLGMKCLQIEGKGCRRMQQSWYAEITLGETEVHRHLRDPRRKEPLQWPWTLEHGQIYPIGREESRQTVPLRARVHLPDPAAVPRLVVSPSAIPMIYMNRIFVKRLLAERLRERLTSSEGFYHLQRRVSMSSVTTTTD